MAYSILANLTALNDPGLAAAYQAGEASTDAPLSRFTMMFPLTSGSYDHALAKPPSGYTSVGEGAEKTPEAYEQVGSASVTPSEYGLAYALSDTAWRTTPRALLMRAQATLGALWVRFLETNVASKLNNAEGSTTTIDGKALGADDHTSDAGDQDNLVTGSLAHSSYQTAVELLMVQKDYRGTLVGGRPSTLLVAHDTMVDAGQVLGSGFTEATDRTKINVLAGSAELVWSADLNAGSWHVVSDMQWGMHGGIAIPVVRGPAPREINEQEGTYRHIVEDRVSLAFANPVSHHGWVVGST